MKLMLLVHYSVLSGRLDLNQRPPAPKAGALTRLRYAPSYQSYTAYQYLGQFYPPILVYYDINDCKERVEQNMEL